MDKYEVGSEKYKETSPVQERRSVHFILYTFPFLLACLLFAPTLNFPLMYDTLLHTQLADGQTILSVFRPNELFGFYRPLVFLPIVVFQNLLGRYPVFLFHLINVVTHGLNAALVARLIWRISENKWQSLAAGLLFATFPFAYQALAIYGNNPYLTATFFILLGLNVSAQRRGWLPLIFLLGVLVHETAVLLVPFVLLLNVLTERTDGRSLYQTALASLKTHTPLLMTCAVYLAIYPFLPRGGGPQLDFGGNALGPKLLLFLQTAAWPFVLPLVQLFSGRSAILLGFALLGGWVVYKRWRAPSATLILGVAWFLLASILIGATLPTYYIQDGARLLYPGGVGVALIWAALIYQKDQSGFQNLTGLISILCVLGIILAGGWFNRRMINLYSMGSQPLNVLNDVVTNTGPDAVMLVNMPQWVAWPDPVFPAGTEFAPVLGSHLFAVELVRANTGQTPEIIVLDVPEALAETDYTYGVYKVGSVGEYSPAGDKTIEIIGADYAENGPMGHWPGTIQPKDNQAAEWSAGRLGFGASTVCETAEGRVMFESLIQPDGPLGDTRSLFVQLISGAGQLVSQNDGPPLGIPPGRLKLSRDVQLVDRRPLDSNEPGSFVFFGVYDFATGERAEALTADGEPVENNAYRVDVQDYCGADRN